MAVQDQQIESKEAELEAITIRIEDTEAFVEEVADAAYEKSVWGFVDKSVDRPLDQSKKGIYENEKTESCIWRRYVDLLHRLCRP